MLTPLVVSGSESTDFYAPLLPLIEYAAIENTYPTTAAIAMTVTVIKLTLRRRERGRRANGVESVAVPVALALAPYGEI